jgi:hypothetical protein
VGWLGNSHLREEKIGYFMVVMLSGMDNAMLDARSGSRAVVGFDGSANRGQLDELRASAHDAHPSNARAVSFHVS